MRYSLFGLARGALTKHRHWQPAWRDAAPNGPYDVIVIGGGGHGLATVYYLARNHGIKKVAVLERGWIGGGNAGRNTTIIRSNYGLDGNIPFYEWSMKLWEGLEQDLNYNAMVSQRGVLNLYHSDTQRDGYARRGNAMRLHGVDAELLDHEAVRQMAPFLNFEHARFPIQGGLLQRRGGTARHDAVVWGYARAASELGVDIIQNCEVTGFIRSPQGRMTGVETTRGRIMGGKIGMAVAGHSSQVAEMAGLQLPIESHVLQAFVTEALKPLIPGVITFGAGHFYVSQSDKGGLCVRRRYRRLQQLCPAWKLAGGRRCLRGRHGSNAHDRPPAHAQILGGHHGHVHGRLTDHRSFSDRWLISERRLVLRRIQGDAGERLVFRSSACAR